MTNIRAYTKKTMKMVCVVFCASLLGTHICRESCLPLSSTQALPKDVKWQSIQSNAPHTVCPTSPPPPGINIDIGALQNH
jgi:hypothetical protein